MESLEKRRVLSLCKQERLVPYIKKKTGFKEKSRKQKEGINSLTKSGGKKGMGFFGVAGSLYPRLCKTCEKKGGGERRTRDGGDIILLSPGRITVRGGE